MFFLCKRSFKRNTLASASRIVAPKFLLLGNPRATTVQVPTQMQLILLHFSHSLLYPPPPALSQYLILKCFVVYQAPPCNFRDLCSHLSPQLEDTDPESRVRAIHLDFPNVYYDVLPLASIMFGKCMKEQTNYSMKG